MTKIHVMFKLLNGNRFIDTMMVRPDEGAKDVVESYIYKYNQSCYTMGEQCNYDYEIYKFENGTIKTTEENIDKLVRKGLNSKSWIYHPEQFTEFSGICSEDLIIMSIRVLSSLSERLGLSDKFITDFIYPISQYKGEDMTANRLKFIVFTILSLDK